MSIPLKKLNVQGKVRLDGKLFPVRFFFFFRDRSSACDSLIAVLLGSNIYRGYAAQRSSSCFASSCPLGYSLATHRIKKKKKRKKREKKTKPWIVGRRKKKKKKKKRRLVSLIEQQKGSVVNFFDDFRPVLWIPWRTALRFSCLDFFPPIGTPVHSFISEFPFVCGLLGSAAYGTG